MGFLPRNHPQPVPPLQPDMTWDDLLSHWYEEDSEGRWWCLSCGVQVRDATWRMDHYEAAHSFKGF